MQRPTDFQFFCGVGIAFLAVVVLIFAAIFGIDVFSAALLLIFVHVGLAAGVVLLMAPFLIIAGILQYRRGR